MRPLPPRTALLAAPIALGFPDHSMHGLEQFSDGERAAELRIDRHQDELSRLPSGRHEHDDLELLQIGILALTLQHVPSVFVRQLRVEDQEVVSLRLERLEPGGAAGCLLDLIAGQLEAQDGLPHMLGTVVDEQDPFLGHDSSVSVRVRADPGKSRPAPASAIGPELVLTRWKAPTSLGSGCYGSPFS